MVQSASFSRASKADRAAGAAGKPGRPAFVLQDNNSSGVIAALSCVAGEPDTGD
jgi:hypothetical protein